MLESLTSAGQGGISSQVGVLSATLAGDAEQRLDLALEDHVTRVGNRRFFEQKLDESLFTCSPGPTVLVVDLDRFKIVNDTLGHAVGDALLRRVAERMQGLLRHTESTLARLGGDEFGILLTPALGPVEVAAIAARLVDLLQRTYLIDGNPVNVGASVGIAIPSESGIDRLHLVKNADLALYHSKNSGRGCFSFFDPSMEARANARRAMEVDLRKALVLRQLELHYKPQIDVQSRRLIGFEAILRWNHPGQGLLTAAQFIPLAEEIGLIDSIGEWVLKSACQEASRWEGDITVSVNVSPVQFEGPYFLKGVQRALIASAFPGRKLELEVTENILLRDEASVVATINAVRALGVQVAIDSFGTGIASLSQLVNFPVDKIKIDRSLISLSETGAKERAIVRAIAALGASLGLHTLAEGVDTLDHLASIRRDGCDAVQGHFASVAVPVADLRSAVEALLTSPQSSQR